MIDLAPSPFAASLSDALTRLCARADTGDALALWRDLAAFGLHDIGLDADSGGFEGLTAAYETLGRAGAPPALVDAVLIRRAMGSGAPAPGTPVALGTPAMFPDAPAGTTFHARSAIGRDAREPFAPEALAAYRLAASGYLNGGGGALLALAADHARDRRQFGRALAAFQAVSHPLASVYIRLCAARRLAAAAAAAWDVGESGRGVPLAAAALASAVRAATAAIHAAHQAHGATGVIVEGPVVPLSLALRRTASVATTFGALRGTTIAQDGGPPMLDAGEAC